MVLVYFTLLDSIQTNEKFNQLLALFPHRVQNDINVYKQKQDQKRKLAGRLLLEKQLRFFQLSYDWDSLQYNDYQKPFFQNGFHFNIAHSENMVACAGTLKGEIGLDIEMLRPIAIEDFGDYFTHGEWDIIRTSDNPSDSLLDSWAKKESFIKAIGMGIHLPLQNIDTRATSLLYQQTSHFFHQINLQKNYKSWLCTEQKTEELHIEKITL